MAGGKLISTGVEFPDATTQTTSGLPLTGGTMTGDVSLGDGVKATFGASDDLQIYHDGSNSYVDEQGTGILKLRGSAGIALEKYDSTEQMLTAYHDDAVTLFHNGSSKLATTSTGIDVTGSVTCDGFTSTGIDDNATSTAITIDSAEHVSLAHGIGFNGDTAAANALDDYEEGTWTPTYALSTPGDSSWTHDRQVASYTKIGDVCTFQCFIRTDAYSNTTGSGDLRVSGLPFASEATTNAITAVAASSSAFATDNNPLSATIPQNVQYVRLYKRADANDSGVLLDENSCSNSTNGNILYISGSYKTA